MKYKKNWIPSEVTSENISDSISVAADGMYSRTRGK